jgi:hypothetical protein
MKSAACVRTKPPINNIINSDMINIAKNLNVKSSKGIFNGERNNVSIGQQ